MNTILIISAMSTKPPIVLPRSASTDRLSCRTPIRHPEIKKRFLYPFFARPKNGYPQERAPCNSAFGFPRETHARGVGTNSHIRALKQRADRNPRAHASLGIVATGFKTHNTQTEDSNNDCHAGLRSGIQSLFFKILCCKPLDFAPWNLLYLRTPDSKLTGPWTFILKCVNDFPRTMKKNCALFHSIQNKSGVKPTRLT